VITLSAREELPPDTVQRLEKFTDLVSTAIANAESKSELTASRRRIVAAADEARRQIERDLHDGIQQSLISLAFRARAMSRAPADELPGIAAELADGLKGGSGILGLKDRIEALGGEISIASPPRGGTTLSIHLPITT
jgi:signal transduction histidine kinase